jgi:hypothetical protein
MGSDSSLQRSTRHTTLFTLVINFASVYGKCSQLSNRLELICDSTQSANPALSSIIRDRRVQILPVQWRALLTFEHEQSEEDAKHDMDNRFTMGDITLNKSIPYVRELTNSVRLTCPS